MKDEYTSMCKVFNLNTILENFSREFTSDEGPIVHCMWHVDTFKNEVVFNFTVKKSAANAAVESGPAIAL